MPEELPLDQNFPEPILRCLEEFILDVKLVPLRQIDKRLSTLDDRELLIALRQLGYSGLVTKNYKMLKNPSELAASLRRSESHRRGVRTASYLSYLKSEVQEFAWVALGYESHLCTASQG